MSQATPANQSAIPTALEFLFSVLPTTGCFYGASHVQPVSGEGGPSVRWKDKALPTIAEIVYDNFINASRGLNTYFALSGFAQGWHTITKANGQTKKVFRVQSNALLQKALWLDIDCKGASPYHSADDGIRALAEFLRQTQMPLPTVVGSGRGIHVYWTFEEAIQTRQWLPLASYLKGLCEHFGLVADHSRTCDPSSVLRLPGTINYGSDGVARPVKLLIKGQTVSVIAIAARLIEVSRYEGLLYNKPIKTSVPVPGVGAGTAPVAPQGLQFDGMSSLTEGPKRHPYRIIKECKQIQTAGLGTYTQWYNMMLVMKHCAFSEQAVHAISKTDKQRYDFNNVQTKYQQAVDGGYGPCRCSTFNEKDPGICTHCPYWKKITTPLQLGEVYHENKPVTVPAPNIQQLSPEQSVVTVNAATAPTMTIIPYHTKDFSVVPGQGIVWHKRELVDGGTDGGDEEGKHFLTKDYVISDTELYIHSVCIDTTGGDVQRAYVIRKQSPGRAPEDILFDVGTTLGTQQMLSWLGRHGMLPVHPRYNKLMSEFMNTYLASVQNKLPEIFVRDTFGWVSNADKSTGETYEGFIVADKMYSQRGVAQVKLNERAAMVASTFQQKGCLEGWKFIPQMYRVLNQPYGMMYMLASLAAPFMRLAGGTATNVAYNIWESRGGKGKTGLLEAAASVWGSPKDLLQSKNDTVSSRFQRYAVHKNLPIFCDEITNMSDSQLSDLVFDIVNGREKSRSTQSGTGLAKSGTWMTTTMFTSNRSIYEILRQFRAQVDATNMRVIEMQCDFQDYSGTKTQQYISTIMDVMRANYGVAGPALLQYCFAHPEVFQEVASSAADFYHAHSHQSDDRFWMYGIAIPLAVGRIAVRAGLIDYDMEQLEKWCLDVLVPTLWETAKQKTASGANLLADYFSEHLNNTLTVMSAERPESLQDMDAITGLDTYVKSYPTNALYIRRELDLNVYYVSAKHLQQWCNNNGLSLEVMLQDLKRHGIWRPSDKFTFVLGRWVRAMNRGRSMVYRFTLPMENSNA